MRTGLNGFFAIIALGAVLLSAAPARTAELPVDLELVLAADEDDHFGGGWLQCLDHLWPHRFGFGDGRVIGHRPRLSPRRTRGSKRASGRDMVISTSVVGRRRPSATVWSRVAGRKGGAE